MPGHRDNQEARHPPTPQRSPAPWAPFRAALGHLVTGKLTLNDLWLLVIPLGMIMLLSLEQIRPHDFWWHLRTGQIIAETGAIPTTDLFSFTRAGHPWLNQAWLAQLLLYLLYRAGGLPLIVFCFSVTIALGYTFVELACLQTTGGNIRAASVAAIGAMALSVIHWSVRPQAASYLLFGALVWILETDRTQGGRAVWALPILFAFWTNLHGGFVFGLGLLGLYVFFQVAEAFSQARSLNIKVRQTLAASLASVLALSLNPTGPVGTVRYVLTFFQSKITLNTNMEFLPLTIRELDGQLFFAVMIIFLSLSFRRRPFLPRYLVAAMIVFGFMSLYTRRVSPWFGLAAAPAFALTLAAPSNRLPQTEWFRSGEGMRGFNYLFMAVLGLLLIVRLPWLRPYLPWPPEQRAFVTVSETPIQATDFICRLGSTVRPFNDMAYGSYLIWACPDVPVFIDTRIELYPTAIWLDYLSVGTGQVGWEKVLARYGVNALLLNKHEESGLIAAARESAAWHMVYEDDYTVLFLARPGSVLPTGEASATRR